MHGVGCALSVTSGKTVTLRDAAVSLGVVAAICGGAARAGEPPAGEEPTPDVPMYETTITATRRREIVFDSPRSVSVVHRDEMDRRLSRTTPEALLEEPGVFLQRTY